MFPIVIANINPFTIVLIVILVVLIAATIALYFFGKKSQEKREEQDRQAAAMAQTASMLIIDKKKMRMKDSGLPQQVLDQTPWYAKMAKVPIVKAKVGPKIVTLIADINIFDEIPLKKEVKATVSGLYITKVQGLRGTLDKPAKKKGLGAKLREKYTQLNAQMQAEKNKNAKKNK